MLNNEGCCGFLKVCLGGHDTEEANILVVSGRQGSCRLFRPHSPTREFMSMPNTDSKKQDLGKNDVYKMTVECRIWSY